MKKTGFLEMPAMIDSVFTVRIVEYIALLISRSGPHFLDSCLRSYFPTYQPAFCSLTDS